MSHDGPLPWIWTGSVMKPATPYTGGQAAERFETGSRYMLVEHVDRSSKSERHYFAVIREGWKNLPERLGTRFPSPEHLRKWALIHAGYRNERTFACETPEEAARLAVWLRQAVPYAVLIVSDDVIIEHTAKSQRRRAMEKDEFQASKDAVLGIIAGMVGVTVEDLSSNAGRAA